MGSTPTDEPRGMCASSLERVSQGVGALDTWWFGPLGLLTGAQCNAGRMMDDLTSSQDGQLPLHGVGDKLRLAREQAGMTLEQLSAETRIPQRHLELIEAGDFGNLPARTYATGFARTYAKAVGLDDRAIVEEVRAELSRIDGSSRGRVQTFEPGDPARVPSRGLALFSLVALVLLLVGGYMFYQRVLAPGAGPPSLLDEPSAPANSAAKPATAAPAVAGPVVFTSLEEGVWVKFYDAAGTQLLQKELAKGESYTVPADATGPQLWTGRPDALAVTIGGSPVPKIAEEQGIVKDVPVTAQALLARGSPRESTGAFAQPSGELSAAPTQPRSAARASSQAARPTPTPAPTARPRSANPPPRRTSEPTRVRETRRPAAQATVSNPVVQPLPSAD